MRTVTRCLLFLLVLASLFVTPNQAMAVGDPGEGYIVRFDAAVTPEDVTEILEQYSVSAVEVFDDFGLALVAPEQNVNLEALAQDSRVEAVSLNGVTQIPSIGVESDQVSQNGNSPLLTVTDPLYVQTQWNIRRLFSDQAWALGQTASHNTTVAIIDTGVAVNHPDLAANIVHAGCFSSYQPTCSTYPQFPSSLGGSHGTRVAGVLGSVIDGAGLVGVAPNVGIASYNVAEVGPDGFPAVYDTSMWAAMRDAADREFQIINFSQGSLVQLPLSAEDRERVENWRRVINKVSAQGVVIVASAGNDSANLDEQNVLAFPCELPNVICVGATAIRPQPIFPQDGFFDIAAFYTNYGSRVDFAAPGGDCGGPDFNSCIVAPDPRYFIWTTTVSSNATCALTQNCPVSYTASIGTSFSAPQAAGVAALTMDAYRSRTGHHMTPAQLEQVLRRTADEIQTNPELGHGMLNAQAAVLEALRLD